MKKMKKILALAVWIAALGLLCASCDNGLDIQQAYTFSLETMPVQKRISVGETAEIRCTLVREGRYDGARYTIRYFQPDGRGELRMDDGTVFLPNDRYLNRYYPYKSERIPVAQFTAEGGYYYKFLADPSRTFFFYLGGSALAGYESVNRGERRLYDGSTLRHRDRFLYGGAVTLEVDAYLTDRIILSLTGRERILWGTTTGHFHAQFGLGVKFIIH